MEIVGEKFIKEMYRRYIKLHLISEEETPGSYNEAYVNGEIKGIQRWLEYFNVDLSYEKTQKEIQKMKDKEE